MKEGSALKEMNFRAMGADSMVIKTGVRGRYVYIIRPMECFLWKSPPDWKVNMLIQVKWDER